MLTAEFYAELGVYFLAAPTLFFIFPLYSAHTRMVEAKQRLLAEIAEQFDLGLVSKFGVAVKLPVLAPLGVDLLGKLIFK